jgi:hypothetical protein
MVMGQGKKKEPGESQEPQVPIIPDTPYEKEVAFFFEEFTLSAGCCSDEVENKVIN